MPPCRIAYEEAKEYLERLQNPDLNGHDDIQTSHVLFVSLTESDSSNVHDDSEDEEPLAITCKRRISDEDSEEDVPLAKTFKKHRWA